MRDVDSRRRLDIVFRRPPLCSRCFLLNGAKHYVNEHAAENVWYSLTALMDDARATGVVDRSLPQKTCIIL